MNRVAFVLGLTLCIAARSQAAFLDGSVFLMPIGAGSEFTSHGRVQLYNDLYQLTPGPLSGTHSVTGPQTFTTAVTGNGQYFYSLRGPAQAGACYGTLLNASADPPGPDPTPKSWTGPTVCADPPEPAGSGGSEDNNNDGEEPMILDLGGDGVLTSSVDLQPVWFDLDGDGCREAIGWTAAGANDGFLAVDWNRNGSIDDGRELFGNATPLPDGGVARHGYEALAAYDLPLHGGNGDGSITHMDRIFAHLRVWVDSDHDGVESVGETSTLPQAGVAAISLHWWMAGPDQNYGRDANGNLHLVQGSYTQRVHGVMHARALHEVFFRTRGCEG